MQFSNIPGQAAVKHQLVQMVQHNRLSHALLFLGREGSASLQLANAMAQYVVCEKVNPTASFPSLFGEEDASPAIQPGDSCGECPGCLKAAKFIHPDIHYSYPAIKLKTEKPKSTDFIVQWREFMNEQPFGNGYDWLQFIAAENKQGNITSEECEDILRKMNLKSFESKYKILIMWLPEHLGKEGNKLLKLIEEPPPETLFIFVAHDDSAILPTILSRTQLIKVPPLSNEDVYQVLIEKYELTQAQASMLAVMSGGNMREAIQQMQHTDEDWSSLLKNWMNSIVKTGPAEQLKSIEAISKIGREKQKQFLRYFTHIIQVSLRLYTQGDAGDAPAEIASFAGNINRMCVPEQLAAMVEELDKSAYYIERNANPKLLFHALTIRLYHIISNKSVILVN